MTLLKDKLELTLEETELQVQDTLNRFSPLQKWIVILGVVATIPAYFIAKAVSGAYWNSRYQPLIIAAKQAFENAKAPQVGEVSLTTSGDGAYSAVVEITNQNIDLSAKSIPYVFEFYGSNGQIVHAENGKLFLLADQKKYVVVPKIASNTKIASAKFSFVGEIAWQKRLSVPKVTLSAARPITYNQPSPQAFVVEGSFTNTSAYSLKTVRLNLLLYDRTGKIIATTYREEHTLQPFERRSYKQMWPGVYSDEVVQVDVLPETNLLDPSNLHLSAEPNTPSSDLNR